LFDLFLDLCKNPELTTSVRQLAEARLDTFKHFQPPPRPKKVRDFSDLELYWVEASGQTGNIGLICMSRIFLICRLCTVLTLSYGTNAYSVPDPPDPHVFGPPGSGSGSTSQRYGSGSGSFYHLAKIVRKTLIPTIL
jgi:hypothetical protein